MSSISFAFAVRSSRSACSSLSHALLNLGDVLEVVDFANRGRGFGDGGGAAAGDVVERLTPRHVHVLRGAIGRRLAFLLARSRCSRSDFSRKLIDPSPERALQPLGLIG